MSECDHEFTPVITADGEHFYNECDVCGESIYSLYLKEKFAATLYKLSDSDLIALTLKKAKEVSMYNAAEGQEWYKEKPKREKANNFLSHLRKEINRRGLFVDLSDQLL